jgi:exopolysaccharide production protein ExoQ
MMSQLATLICLLFILYLLWIDRKSTRKVSGAVWIPLAWMFFAGSRYASQWLNLESSSAPTVEQLYVEGSPLDRNVFLLLILGGVWVLKRRRIDWSGLFARNAWICLFFLFAALSVLWADDPFVSFKRWIKGVGNMVMVLIILTEPRPIEALGLVLRRLGYLLIPLSVLFIKFYPDLGRSYHMGNAMYTGVAFQKNSLGQLCLVVGIYFFWEFLFGRGRAETSGKQLHYSIYLIMLAMTAWLLYMAQSATAIACMAMIAGFFLACRIPVLARRPKRLVGFGMVFLFLAGFLEFAFDIKDSLIRILGRRPDLTDRTPVWELVLGKADSPLIGAGYESFWSGERLLKIWASMGTGSGGIIQAHNGYIEVYLSLGIIGLVLLLSSIGSGLVRSLRCLETEFAYGVLRISFILFVVVSNYTEASFKPVNNLFVLLLFGMIELPRSRLVKRFNGKGGVIIHGG